MIKIKQIEVHKQSLKTVNKPFRKIMHGMVSAVHCQYILERLIYSFSKIICSGRIPLWLNRLATEIQTVFDSKTKYTKSKSDFLILKHTCNIFNDIRLYPKGI